ncbi:MAG: PAS domain S-box protein [Pseudomonadota bacterium]
MARTRIRILIVEDDLVDRMAFRRALAQNPDYEFELSEIETGRDGLQLARRQKPDCIFLDYQLPDMNGLEFLAELRSDPGEIPVPVIMLTGTDNVSVAVEAMKNGAQDYLVKDLNRQYLKLLPAVIQRILHERQMLTEKQLVKAKLVQAEAKYRNLVEQIPAITYSTSLDAPATLTYISPQIRQLGFPAEEWLTDPEGLLKQIHPEDQARMRAEIAHGFASGQPLHCEYRMFDRAGGVRWFLNEASLVRSESDEPLFLQGVLIDITESKQAEKLRQAILNSVFAGIAVLDGNGVIVAVNELWRHFTEHSIKPGTDIGANYLEAWEGSDSVTDEARNGIRSVLDGRLKSLGFEYFCSSPQQQYWFRVNATLLGETVNDGVVITHTDITEHKRAEENIRQSRDQLKAFIAQAPISIAMVDQDMNYLAVSGRWLEEYGRGYADLVGRNHYKVFPDMPDRWKVVHRQALAGASLENKDDMWVGSDGSKHWLRWAVLPWVDENKKIGGIIISAENIADTKKLEMEIAQRRNEMEHLQKMHVAAQTASAIAHEMNQPLLAIASYCQAALMMIKAKEPDPFEICNAIKNSEQQALRAGRSIRDLISFLSRSDLSAETLDLSREIIDIVDTAESEHGLAFHPVLKLEDRLPPVRANRIHVQKVTLNLLHNSIEAIQAAGTLLPAITVTLRRSKNKDFIQMTIQDNGPGIEKEELHRLFEPFFTTKTKGIGMGLSISRSLIEENGGQLWFESKKGQGAIFHLTLPIAT